MGGKLNMVHIQNSTLAGGVAVGAIGNFIIQPWGAILVGIVAAIVSAVAKPEVYKDSWASVFELDPEGAKKSITGGQQAGNQMLALVLTLVFAVVGGVVTGFILKIPIWGRQADLFEDAEAWILEEEEEDEEKQQPLQSLPTA